MKVIFFEVDGVLNFPGSEAKSPSGRMGVADAQVKELKRLASDSGARIVLTGSWAKDWDFNDEKCTPDGAYLNKKLDRKGLHILDKTEDTGAWLLRHPNVTDYCVLKNLSDVRWEVWT